MYNDTMRTKNDRTDLAVTRYTVGETKMENQTQTVDGNQIELASLRDNVGEAVKRSYGAERAYAVKLNDHFKTFDWFEIEANETSDQAKLVHAEKGLLYAVLKKAEHKNPSTVWARIRKYGKEEKYPKVEGGEGGEGGEGEGEGEGDGAGSNDRSPMLRNLEELTKLYKFNKRQQALPDKIRDAQTHIASALIALGVDLSTLQS